MHTTTIRKYNRNLVLLFFMIAFFYGIRVSAQNQYLIDIKNQDYSLQSGFLKMGSNTSPNGHVLSYNSSYLLKDGKPWFPIMGEMHFSRVAETEWEASILKMKSAGIQIISTYIFWNHHENTEGVFDWKGNKNLSAFLSLCKKHNMYVWLRPGPWVHAEARNGGFPDWLLAKKIPLRTNDETYLKLCNIFFKEIANQCKGQYFKNGGPIIGLQIENELAYKSAPKYEHMKTLKNLLIQAGFDVPYYSAFAQGPENQNEFLYMLGSYPDSPWAQSTKKLYKPMYFIRRLEGDSDIGSDLFGKVDNRVRNTYPKLSAELGSGMQVTYHRRVVVSPKDVVGVAFTKVASGLNGLGYYMYHGGVNPIDKTTLQESRETGYPNDVPIINYDFQSPLGAMNIEAESNMEFRLLHMFLTDFGNDLVTKNAFFPKELAKSYFPKDTVQASVRVHNNSGFIFLNNYQRFSNLPSVRNFQLKLTTNQGEELIPNKPTVFPANSFAVWPYHLKIGRSTLQYATAQPLCILNKKTYVFFTQGDAEFVLNKQEISDSKMYKISQGVNDTRINIPAKTTVIVKLKDGFELLIIDKDLALHANKVLNGTKELLVITDAGLLVSDKKIILEKSSSNGKVDVLLYPNGSIISRINGFQINPNSASKIFKQYEIKANNRVVGEAIYNSNNEKFSATETQNTQDSILKRYALSKNFNPLQPGPFYQPSFTNLPNQKLYNVSYKVQANPLIKNWIVDFNYAADAMAIYKNNQLVYDQFNYNNHCNFLLSTNDIKKDNAWKLQLFPIKKEYKIYVEDGFLKSKETDWPIGLVKQINLTPIWNFEIEINN